MKLSLLFIAILLLSACKNNRDEYLGTAQMHAVEGMPTQEHPGKKLMENNCNICHNPKTAEESIIAPPMVAVKMHYISEETTKAEFVDAMVAWTKEPSVAKSKMPGAIKKFGLMPYQFYPEKTIRQIADYMFDNEIEKPVWFDAHYKKMHGDRPKMKGKKSNSRGKGKQKGIGENNLFEQHSSKERGMQIAQTTKAELGKNLMGQIQKNGVIEALNFCNVQAMPITDSMATIHKATIKRVTDKPRNPKNTANSQELEFINQFKTQIATGREVEPILVKKGNNTEFYLPIVTNTMCLQCHGTPGKELETITLAKIKQLYPLDMATGYSENEVRGIWSINFNN
ncbi:Tll0287-like domain-containing protein [Aequorivita xiaoshiensis]|uniref:DUF3365 domain-containing protein n=1 Tax=Aequorivita xiaoshiensis TaxID=2874476 RepID=A0A9X1U6E9_9FLAO|nr:DUF3365 domain-containing protein [Aequorivita xiaoshiensis]MCG2431533.1 DUF3365 domain-containing protein [Aequorivita xiaoshiensis]